MKYTTDKKKEVEHELNNMSRDRFERIERLLVEILVELKEIREA